MSPAAKDLISRLLERKPAKRIGMLAGRAAGELETRVGMWFSCLLCTWTSPLCVITAF